MADTALGLIIRFFRDRKGLSLRELGRQIDVDHAYIHRLERGDKHTPSLKLLERLVAALNVSEREKQILLVAVQAPDSDPALAQYALENDDVTPDEYRTAASVAFRGTGRPDPESLIKKVRLILGDDDG